MMCLAENGGEVGGWVRETRRGESYRRSRRIVDQHEESQNHEAPCTLVQSQESELLF